MQRKSNSLGARTKKHQAIMALVISGFKKKLTFLPER